MLTRVEIGVRLLTCQPQNRRNARERGRDCCAERKEAASPLPQKADMVFLVATLLLPATLGLPIEAASSNTAARERVPEASVLWSDGRFEHPSHSLSLPAQVVADPLPPTDVPEEVDEEQDARRRLGWRFWEKNEDAVWKATSSCPWICKQGWWWQSDAYAKPACCNEVRDSPYDNCEHDQCSCDASCRSCCE